MMKYIGVFLVIFIMLSLFSFITFIIAFGYDESQLDDHRFIGELFTCLLVVFQFPLFNIYKLIEQGFPYGDKFWIFIFIDVGLYSFFITLIIWIIRKKIKTTTNQVDSLS